VYTDGSVLVAHGGTEMGQGLFTKVIQIAAQCFQIPDTMVFTSETSTNTVANASPSAASMSTDLYGMAVLDACEQILDRLRPLRQQMPNATWQELVHAAYFQRINLSAQGFYVVPGDRCGYDWSKSVHENAQLGTPFNYFTQGVACSEVEIDVLTGDSKILRTDILMDVGKSINPALDIGQIEGAFIQGFGWCTMEELLWGQKKDFPWIREGQLFTRGPGTYKIPAFNDVPLDLRVHLTDTDNRFAVHSSKAIGEPPFFLGASVFFAIKVINAYV
jgi:xanthine dehydrogenase/oxidase